MLLGSMLMRQLIDLRVTSTRNWQYVVLHQSLLRGQQACVSAGISGVHAVMN